MKGLVHSTESFGSADGPGVRFVVFFQGCLLHCRYCHNPDTWCKEKMEQAKWYTADELLGQAVRYKAYWGKNGGITACGGEPMLQMDFLTEFFEKAKEQGIHTTLDTAGQPFCDEEPFYSGFLRLMKVTDLVMLDIKVMDEKAHYWLTGHTNKNILQMAETLSNLGIPMWLRRVLVPGVTDGVEDLKAMADFMGSLRTIERVEVLPYHTLGLYKWKESGLEYSLEGCRPPTEEEVAKAELILNQGLRE